MAQTSSNPKWDLTLYFPNPDGKEIAEEVEHLILESEKLLHFVQNSVIAHDLAVLEPILSQTNGLLDRMRKARSYLYCAVAADSKQTAAQKLQSRLLIAGASLSKANSLLTKWVGEHQVEDVIGSSETSQAHAYYLRRLHFSASHQMSMPEEELAADLTPSAQSAWARFYGNYSSQIKVEVQGFEEPIPMSQVRTLASDSDRAVRKNAYDAELEAWESHSTAISAALNGVKGWALTVGGKRGWKSPLQESLFRSGIDEATLDAMLGAARDAFPQLRRYLHAKAKAIGVTACAFYDLFAPLPLKDPKVWEYPAACEFVQKQFHDFSPAMGNLAQQSYQENWIDVDPRPGKRDGAFCSSTIPGKSLVLMNFRPTYNSVGTLAHELGHAYHNYCLRNRTDLQTGIPMTLAETASTFCETICRKAAIESGNVEESLAILEASLQGATQIVLDITSRFLFEFSLFAGREKGELSSQELCAMMKEAQVETYGDGLTDELHPYMWAAKPHYYGSNFYNFPYMFGLLFSLGLYAIYQESGPDFVSKYDDLLSRSGMASPAELASEFGFDITKGKFWQQSLQTIVDDVDQFEKRIETVFSLAAAH